MGAPGNELALSTDTLKFAELQTALKVNLVKAWQQEKGLATLWERAQQNIHRLETDNKALTEKLVSRGVELQTALKESQAQAAQQAKDISTLQEREQQKIHHLETDNEALTEKLAASFPLFLSPAALEAQQTENSKVAELQTALEESQARAAQLEKLSQRLGNGRDKGFTTLRPATRPSRRSWRHPQLFLERQLQRLIHRKLPSFRRP